MRRFLGLFTTVTPWSLCSMVCTATLLAHFVSASRVIAEDDLDSTQIVFKQYELGLSLLKRPSSEPNTTLSPYSIHAGLTLARLGAVGATAVELDNLLFSEAFSERTIATYSSLNSVVAPSDAKSPAKLANSVWIDRRGSFLPQFLHASTSGFKAEAHSINFNNSDLARKKINDWVSSKTNAMIPNLLQPGMPGPQTSAALINALHFKAPWDTPFSKNATRNQDFRLSNGTTISIPMMHTKASLPYIENDTWQGIALSYAQGTFSYLLFVPREKLSAKEVRSLFSRELVGDILTSSKRARVSLSVPRHTIRLNKQLGDDIRALGAKLALSEKADFSAMTSLPVAIEDVVHESVVRIDEVGTEAAAATAMVMTKTALFIAEESKTVIADHPFAFALVHTETQAPLFIGVVGSP